MKRPWLRKIDLLKALFSLSANKGTFITLSVGQWDKLLQTAYEAGWVLIEVNKDEKPIAAYQKVS